MEDKEIEKLLKESAEKIEMKDFGERWEAITDRLEPNQACECQETVQSAVLATSTNITQSDNKRRKKIICLVCGVFVAVALCLAITLPILMRKKEEPKRYWNTELSTVNVTESEFYNDIAKSALKLIDLSDFELDMFTVYYVDNNKLVGGRVDAVNEELGVFIELVFLADNVISKFDVGTDYKEYTVNGYKIKYDTKSDDIFYSTKAKVSKAKIVYELTITSFDDNLESLFDKLFN